MELIIEWKNGKGHYNDLIIWIFIFWKMEFIILDFPKPRTKQCNILK